MRGRKFVALLLVLLFSFGAECDKGPPRATFVSWSPDGSRVGYILQGKIQFQKAAEKPGDAVVVDQQAAEEHFAWWPDGKSVVFASDVQGWDLYRYHLDGGEVEKLAAHWAKDSWPVVTPDGRRVLFVSFRDRQADVYALDVETEAVERLTRDQDEELELSLSADGTELAYAVALRKSGYALRLLDVATGRIRTLVREEAAISQVLPSPDGRWVAYRTEEDVHLVPGARPGAGAGFLGLEKVRRVATGPCAWSPDSRRLAFFEKKNLVFKQVNEHAPVLVIQPEADEAPLSWSSDGGRLAFGGPSASPFVLLAEFSEPRGGWAELDVFDWSQRYEESRSQHRLPEFVKQTTARLSESRRWSSRERLLRLLARAYAELGKSEDCLAMNRHYVQDPVCLADCLEALVKGLLEAGETEKAEALLGRFDREVTYGDIGVEVAESPQEPGGLVVTSVAKGSPAEKEGLQPGDVIDKVSGVGVVGKAAFERAVRSAYPGENLRVSLRRGEQIGEGELRVDAAPVREADKQPKEVPPALQQAWGAVAKQHLSRGEVQEAVRILARWGPKRDEVIVRLLFLQEISSAKDAPAELQKDGEVRRYVELLSTLSGAALNDALTIERCRYLGQEKDVAEAMREFVRRWPSAEPAATYAKELMERYGKDLNYAAAQELVDFLRTAQGFALESLAELEERAHAVQLNARLRDAELSLEKKHFVEAVGVLSDVCSEVATGRVRGAYVNWSATVRCFAHLDLAGRHTEVNDLLAVLARGEHLEFSGVDEDTQRLWIGAHLRDIAPEAVLHSEFWKLPHWAKQRLPSFASLAMLTRRVGDSEETWLNLGKEMVLSPDAVTVSRTLQDARTQWQQKNPEDYSYSADYQVLLMLGGTVYQSRGMYREAADVYLELVGLGESIRPDVFPTRAEFDTSPPEAVGLYLDVERKAGNGLFVWLRSSPLLFGDADIADKFDQWGAHNWADFVRQNRKEAPRLYRRLASQYPHSRLAAFALYRLGQWEAVIRQYPSASVAERASQDLIRSYESRGNYWLGTLRADELLEHLKGQDRTALLWLAGSLWDERLGSFEHATQYYQEIADLLPGSRPWPEAEWRLAEHARKSEAYGEAISRAEALEARAPEDQHVKDGDVTALLARAFHGSGRGAKATELYAKLLRDYAGRRGDPALVAEGLSRMPAEDAGRLYQEFDIEFLRTAMKAGEKDKAKLLPVLEQVDEAAGRKLEAVQAAQEMLVALAEQDYKHLAEVLSRRAEVEVDPNTLPKCLPFEGLGEHRLEAVELRDGAARVLFTVGPGPGRDVLVVEVLLAEREGSWKLDLEGMRAHIDLSSTAWTPQQRQFLVGYPVFAVEQRQ